MPSGACCEWFPVVILDKVVNMMFLAVDKFFKIMIYMYFYLKVVCDTPSV